MSIKLNIMSPDDSLIIKYKGLMDLDSVYRLLREWFEKRGFEHHEYNYKSKDPTVGQLEMYWQGWRNDSDFLRMWIKVYLHFEGMEQVDVIKDSKRKKMYRGRLRLKITPQFEVDYESKFEINAFTEAIRHFYVSYVWRKKMLAYGDKEEYEVHKLHEEIKKRLAMSMTGDQFSDIY